MTTAVQHRRGTTSEHSSFTGLVGEVTIDTTKDTAVIHDGSLAGGYPLAKENLANVTPTGLTAITGADTASDDKFFIFDQSASALKSITRAELNNAIEQDALANVAITGGTINGTSVGATTPSTGSFTTLAASSAVTLSGGTANGVAYLNGSKVLTTGSALTFDGTTLSNTSGGVSASGQIAGVGFYSAGQITMQYSATTATLLLYNDSSTALSNVVQNDIRMNSTTSNRVINRIVHGWGDNTDATRSSYMAFQTSSGGGVGEKMRIAADGNVGIGTSSPTNKLHVLNSSTIAAAVFENTSAGSASIELKDGAATPNRWWLASGLGTPTDGTFSIYDRRQNVSRLAIDSSGNVGIGASSPAYRLDAQSSDAFVARLATSSTNALLLFADPSTTGAGPFVGSAGNSLTFGRAGVAEYMRIDASGNVGIGTSSPSVKLQVNGAAAIQGAGSPSSGAGLELKYDGTRSVALSYNRTGAAYLPLWTDASEHLWYVSGTERARIDSSGNLLVGTTTSGGWSGDARVVGTKLDGAGWGISAYKSATTNTAGGAIICRVDATTSMLIGFYYNGATIVGTISTDGTNTAYNTSSDYRLKNITGPVTNSGAYIDSLKPVEGTWKADGSTFVGLIAHEVQEVSRTQVATGEKDGEQMQAMDYSSSEIIANLIAEVQSLRKRLAALEAV